MKSEFENEDLQVRDFFSEGGLAEQGTFVAIVLLVVMSLSAQSSQAPVSVPWVDQCREKGLSPSISV